jgi:hypothetical protein
MKPIYAKKIVKELEIPASLPEKRGEEGWGISINLAKKALFCPQKTISEFCKENF